VILNASPSAEAACRNLVDLANTNGGSDNITLIVSYFKSPKIEEPKAFVEAEVPLETLTTQTANDAADTAINLKPAQPGGTS
jgi:serine/threonine protein phosphatase PrpC